MSINITSIWCTIGNTRRLTTPEEGEPEPEPEEVESVWEPAMVSGDVPVVKEDT